MDEQANQRIHALEDELKQLKKDYLKLRADLSDIAASILHRGKEEFNARKDAIIDDTKHRCEDIEKRMSDHPIKTLLVGFGLGFVISYLRRDKNSCCNK